MIQSRWTLGLSLAIVFASGALVGALGHRYYSLSSVSATNKRPRTPEDYRNAYLKEMRTRLKLSQEQADKLDVILDQSRDKFRDFREKHRPEMKAIQDEQTASIKAMLSAEQQAEYERMHREREERKKAAERERRENAPSQGAR